MTRSRSILGGSIAVPPSSRPEAQPPLAPAQSLVAFIGPRGTIAALATDAERSRGLLPGHMLAEHTTYCGIPLDAGAAVGVALPGASWLYPGALVEQFQPPSA